MHLDDEYTFSHAHLGTCGPRSYQVCYHDVLVTRTHPDVVKEQESSDF